MSRSVYHPGSDLETLRQLSEGLLRSAGRTNVRGNVLELHHPHAPLFDPVLLHPASELFGISISLSQDRQDRMDQRLRCDCAALPFQDGVFRMVVLQHIVSHGQEAELAEAKRVLAPDGVLLILGLNRMGWRFQTQGPVRRLPGLAPFRVRTQLERLDMTMQGFAGAGLGGARRPAFMNTGLAGLGVAFADLLLLQARHRDSPQVTPLRFRKARSGVVQSAAMWG